MSTISYEHEGQRHEVTFQIHAVGARCAGRLGTEDLPRDDQQYAYTHGSPGYQAACRAVWATAEWREAVADYEEKWGQLSH